MRSFLAVFFGTLVLGTIASVVLATVSTLALVALDLDDTLSGLMLVAAFPVGYAFAGWASYRLAVRRSRASVPVPTGPATMSPAAAMATTAADRPARWAPFFAFLVVAAVVAHCSHDENEARKRAQDFCDTAQVGDAMAAIVERASKAGDRRYLEPERVVVLFRGSLLRSAHTCEIEGHDGRVRDKRLQHLD